MRRSGVRLVKALADELQDQFKDEGGAQVYLDELRLKPGFVWNEGLRTGLCRSAVTIAFLLRTYFESEYCKTEWAISEELNKLRVPNGVHEAAIIPILLKRDVPLPQEVARIQYSDAFQELLVSGSDPTKHDKWPQVVDGVIQRIYELMELVSREERDWPNEERIALTMSAKKFTWTGSKATGDVKREGGVTGEMPRPRFPRIAVEQ
jgi:hypothetical protein